VRHHSVALVFSFDGRWISRARTRCIIYEGHTYFKNVRGLFRLTEPQHCP
jgi:hypothetical protein